MFDSLTIEFSSKTHGEKSFIKKSLVRILICIYLYSVKSLKGWWLLGFAKEAARAVREWEEMKKQNETIK